MSTENDTAESPRVDWIELISVLLIALTTVFTAWSAFEASKWGGVMAIRFNEAGAARTESARHGNEADAQIGLDVNLFTQYVAAIAEDDTELADFLEARFPDRLGVAVEAWLQTEPLQNPDAPASPFDMEEYRLDARETADELETRADRRSSEARDANQTGDNYTITSVFFAAAILLAALSSKVTTRRIQKGMVIGSAVILVVTAVVVATFPIEV